jgi:hypothetical protein
VTIERQNFDLIKTDQPEFPVVFGVKNGLMNILWCFDVQGGFYISYISYVKEKIFKKGMRDETRKQRLRAET